MSSVTKAWKQDMYEITSNLWFENLKNFRNGKVRTVFSIAALLSSLFILVPVLTGSDFPVNSISFISNIIGFADLLYLLFALFLGADAINREHVEKTALLIYPYPQKRTNLIISKYVIQLITSWVAIIFFYSIIAGATIVIYSFDDLPKEFMTSVLFSFLYMSTLLSFAFLLSAWLDSTSASTTLTFFGVMIFLPLSNMLLGIANIDTTLLFTNYSGNISSTLGIQSSGGFGPSSTSSFEDAIIVLTVQSIVFLTFALFFAIKKEVN